MKKKKSDFDINIKSKAEKEKIKPENEFIKEVQPEEIKDFAKKLKRKKFEGKHRDLYYAQGSYI